MKSTTPSALRCLHLVHVPFFFLTGDAPLDFDADESPVFLSMDWRNSEHAPNHCVVAIKSSVEFEELSQENSDPSAGDSPNQRRLTLHHCLQQFMQSEVLSREEAWYCPKYGLGHGGIFDNFLGKVISKQFFFSSPSKM